MQTFKLNEPKAHNGGVEVTAYTYSFNQIFAFSLRLLLVLFLSVALMGVVLADGDNGGGSSSSKFVGHYKGYLDTRPFGIPRLEEFQVTLQQGGTASIVVDEASAFDPGREEMESTALGSWEKTGPNEVIIGAIQVRVGNRICKDQIQPPLGRGDQVCTIQFGLRVTIDKEGNMEGNFLAKIQELNEFPKTFDPDELQIDEKPFPNNVMPLVGVKRTKLSDFLIPD